MSPPQAPAPSRQRQDRCAARWVLVVLCGAQCALFIDVATITVCLPSIRETFALGRHDIQWVVTSYALTFGGLLLIGGRVSDVYGPRRVLVIGLAAFACGSAGVGLAHSFLLLCVCRALEGAGCALLAPAALSLTNRTFVRESDRLRAFAHYGTALAAGFAFGALAGGLLATVQWRAAMFINVPLCLAIAVLALVALPSDVAIRPQPLNLVHAVVATGGVLCAVYAAAQVTVRGLTSWTVVAAGLAATTLVAVFARANARSRTPLIPRALVTPDRNVAMVAATLSAATGGSAQYVATTYLQIVRRHDALTTGAAVSALGIAAIGAGQAAPWLVRRLGLPGALGAGLTIEALGALGLATTTGLGPIFVGTAMATVGLGLVLATVAYTSCALHGSIADVSGVMTGLLRSSEQVGGAVGFALVAGIAGAHLHSAALVAAAFSVVAALVAPELLRRR